MKNLRMRTTPQSFRQDEGSLSQPPAAGSLGLAGTILLPLRGAAYYGLCRNAVVDLGGRAATCAA